VEHPLAFGQAEDERVHGAELLLIQLDPHRGQLVGEAPPPRAGADLAEFGCVPDVRRIDKCRNQRLRPARRAEHGGRKGSANLIDPALPSGVIHGGEHGNIGVEPNQQRRGLLVMFDDQRRAAFLQRLEDRVEVAREFGSGNDFEHDAMVDRLLAMVKQELMRGSTISAVAKRAAIAVILITSAACQQGSVVPSVSATTSSSPKTSPLAACSAGSASPGPQVLLQKQLAPDDLAFDSDGRLLFSDIKTGAVSALNADGSVERIAGGMLAPEGIVVQADGRILVAEQGRNRVVAIDPNTHAVTPWHAFPNRTGRDGIDGIGPVLPSKDAQGNLLPTADNVIVPDSPNGVVWRVTTDGKTATQIASGMVRPVGAAVDASGRIFVADEGGALWALTPAKVRFATLS